MTMRADFERVMQARERAHAAKTLPERFYLILCYQAATQAFFEKHMENINRMIPIEGVDSTRWVV